MTQRVFQPYRVHLFRHGNDCTRSRPVLVFKEMFQRTRHSKGDRPLGNSPPTRCRPEAFAAAPPWFLDLAPQKNNSTENANNFRARGKGREDSTWRALSDCSIRPFSEKDPILLCPFPDKATRCPRPSGRQYFFGGSAGNANDACLLTLDPSRKYSRGTTRRIRVLFLQCSPRGLPLFLVWRCVVRLWFILRGVKELMGRYWTLWYFPTEERVVRTRWFARISLLFGFL